jgi:hypothetical protein
VLQVRYIPSPHIHVVINGSGKVISLVPVNGYPRQVYIALLCHSGQANFYRISPIPVPVLAMVYLEFLPTAGAPIPIVQTTLSALCIMVRHVKKIVLIFSITLFGWIGWWLGASYGIMTAYFAGLAGSLVGVYIGCRVNRDYLS